MAERPFTIWRKMHRAARAIAFGPFEFEETIEHRGAERAGQMMAAHAPVETGFAQWATFLCQRIEIDTEIVRKFFAAFREPRFVAARDVSRTGQVVE